ncbi:hypothetical protein QYE76_010001 [Lolium multiflorum]|uniref:Uncharacterized protein n=1 Tax=Lolium multiflorum TaxID=4521 RepID=A0AAD8X481_LOLMU|nr:hypothetical protein QYE76_010001 [Lolium multiflorum]
MFSQELLISTLVVVVSMYLYFRSGRSKHPASLPTNWPIFIFSSLVANLHNLHDYFSVLLAGLGHNFKAHGPPGTGMRFFVTCDPANVRHIFTTNYNNFPKGAEFASIFDIMGGSLFTSDGEACERQHAKIRSLLSSPLFVGSVAARCRDKVEKGLLPFLTTMASSGTQFDVQELMVRCMFDLTSAMVFGVDPGLLSPNMPPMDASDAMDTVMDVGFLRHAMPASCWKAMRWLNIGPERKLRAAQDLLRGFVAEMMMDRRTSNGGPVFNDEEQMGVEDILSAHLNNPYYADYDLLRGTLIGTMLAGRDTIGTTLPWFFYNLAQNPDTVTIIRKELSPIASRKTASGAASAMVIFEPDETKSMAYLRAALYETLRLYPPGPTERKTVAVDDIMPSGHEVHAGDTILISVYAMGRMEGLWGQDCLDYKPERWLSENGKELRYVPSHKFLAFNSGPRTCPGKEIAVMQMKTIVSAVVWNFDMEVVEGQTIQPKMSSLLQMKNGLAVKLKRREI